VQWISQNMFDRAIGYMAVARLASPRGLPHPHQLAA
jgi:hypothetical protein